jgi:SAM-dependent methyltransferase
MADHSDATSGVDSSLAGERLAAATFNAYLLAHAVWAVNECELVGSLRTGMDPETLDHRQRELLLATLAVLEDHGVVDASNGTFRLTPIGESMLRFRGFFTWAIGGYSAYLEHLPRILLGGSTPPRNERNVARGSAQVDVALMRDDVGNLLRRLRPTRIADLGCGDASRLCDYLLTVPEASGIGLERSAAAAELAHMNSQRLGLTRRLDVLEGDCLDPIAKGPFEDVELVMSFFLLHDLLMACTGDFNELVFAIRRNFPAARRLVLADTTNDHTWTPAQAPPIFVRGFELAHAAMGVPLRSRKEYENLFHQSGVEIEDVITLAVPNSYVFVLEI